MVFQFAHVHRIQQVGMFPKGTCHFNVDLVQKVFDTGDFKVDFTVLVGDTYRGQDFRMAHKHRRQ